MGYPWISKQPLRDIAIKKTPRNMRSLTYLQLRYALAAKIPIHRPISSGFKSQRDGVVTGGVIM